MYCNNYANVNNSVALVRTFSNCSLKLQDIYTRDSTDISQKMMMGMIRFVCSVNEMHQLQISISNDQTVQQSVGI
jgi:hypothetical protein